jgi:hypothetical protein
MGILIQVRAAILQDDETVIQVGGLERCRENDAACGDAEQSSACRHRGRATTDVRADARMDSAAVALKEFLVWHGRLDGAEEYIPAGLASGTSTYCARFSTQACAQSRSDSGFFACSADMCLAPKMKNARFSTMT